MKASEFFQKCYVINLPYRADRRRVVTRELAKAGLPLTPGRVELFPAVRPPDAGTFPSIGARGCFLSHLGALKAALQSDADNVLVMEDDLAISPHFPVHQEVVVDQLRTGDWDMAYLGHIETVPADFPIELRRWHSPIQTAHFYAVNGRILPRLVAHLEEVMQRPGGHPLGGPMHVDGAYWVFRQQNPDVITLVSSPNLGWQRSSRSDIWTGAWFDRMPVMREVAGAVRGAATGGAAPTPNQPACPPAPSRPPPPNPPQTASPKPTPAPPAGDAPCLTPERNERNYSSLPDMWGSSNLKRTPGHGREPMTTTTTKKTPTTK